MKVYFEFLVEQSSVDVLSVRIAVSMTVLTADDKGNNFD